ncbi:hypothetical protein F511_43957 [Dorcoceras hygrometricum]|uniref:Uncharacterized protein n=1 Tax=Dorcoceras hygrometricum TaxID=472368 RepID=A0A2Z7BYI9_9LAMI|nr:hypothetical protein F511_43957 [Dorcoceras hygrometricum]
MAPKTAASLSQTSRRGRRPPCAAATARLRRKICFRPIPPASPSKTGRRRRNAPPPPPVFAGKFVSGQFDEENPFVLISSVLLVQPDEGVSVLVVDRIGDIYRNLPRRADVIVTTVGARHKCQQGSHLNIL